jgi:hypothetical protein
MFTAKYNNQNGKMIWLVTTTGRRTITMKNISSLKMWATNPSSTSNMAPPLMSPGKISRLYEDKSQETAVVII